MANNNKPGNIGFACSNQVLQNSGSTLTVDYSHEEERMKSFVSWPIHYPVDPLRLAKAGFYYAGNEDEVICFSCHGQIRDWNYDDIVQRKHATLFPDCDFVNGRSKNVPVVCKQNLPDLKNPTSETFVNEILRNINYDKMKSLDERMKTFANKWPLREVDFSKLAEAGFFYLGIEDKVQCPFCKGIVTNWGINDDPFEEHKKYFPWCDYLSDAFKNQNVENSPTFLSNSEDLCGNMHSFISNSEDLCGNMQTHSVEKSQLKIKLIDPSQEHLNLDELGVHLYIKPAVPEYANLSSRLDSFAAWPSTAPVPKEKLAEAGFYYMGLGDHTKCFHCNAGLCNWDVGDDPWLEHAKWYNNCRFLRLNKGDEFVDNAFKAHVPKSMQMPSNEEFHFERICDHLSWNFNKISLEKSRNILSKFVWEPHWLTGAGVVQGKTKQENNDRSVSAYFCSEPLIAKVDKAMTSNAVQFVLDCGLYPPYLVRVAVLRKIAETGSSFDDLDEICTAVSILREEMEQGATANAESADNESDENLNETTANESESPISAVAAANDEPQDSSQKMNQSSDCAEEDRKTTEDKTEPIKDYALCKICMDKEVQVVFLPCGHFLACVECAGCMVRCPTCRNSIIAVVKAILS